MCDTQVQRGADAMWFAKNSDREPGEPQAVIRLPRVVGDPRPRLRATHIEIEQVPERHAVILSKPTWVWGAEIGVNERGVAIGNEAIFSRLRTRARGLLGMDLVRLGLERGHDAEHALGIMTGLLEHYGQGGPAGYRDGAFHYDNSYLIADARDAWVLETAGPHWAAKRIERHWAISNALTLARDYDRCAASVEADGRPDFARTFDTRVMPLLARAQARRGLSMRCLAASDAPGFATFFGHLRAPRGGDHEPLAGGNGRVCMHAAGPIRRSQTTGSLVARLGSDGPQVFATGTSAPCLSLFRPVDFDAEGWSVLTPLHREPIAPLWRQHEAVHRRALFDARLRPTIRADIDATEPAVVHAVEQGDPERANALCREWDRRQRDRIAGTPLDTANRPAGWFWRRQNRLDRIE